ncbi:MarR family winged helix-turn-helix transcriptional regulator [Litchfieldia alkalitelluris]|uniref:MarR family winged helix-turn-helix transcriptional regulator n=1 Tax=Litchfieldia alkalitelluris TaxID=304268 RepID=UPI0014753961|nr:MarR family transcriptional regulator [Litchfieldia alkalitelluris]
MQSRDDLVHELEKQFRIAFRQLKSEINDLFKNEITSNEYAILRFLSHFGPQMASAISKEFNVSASHITAVTDSLYKQNLIKRERSETDRRIVHIIITDEGKDLVKRLEALKHNFLYSKFDSLSDEEIQTMIKIYKKILK